MKVSDMHGPSKIGLPDADVFRLETRITLADVLAQAEIALEGTAHRDTRSAFAALTRAGVKLDSTVATPNSIRGIFENLSPVRLSESPRSAFRTFAPLLFEPSSGSGRSAS